MPDKYTQQQLDSLAKSAGGYPWPIPRETGYTAGAWPPDWYFPGGLVVGYKTWQPHLPGHAE